MSMKHKVRFTTLAAMLCGIQVAAQEGTVAIATEQEPKYELVFEDMVGMLDRDGRTVLSGNGYSIVIEDRDWKPSHKAYQNTMKKLQSAAVATEQDNPAWPSPNMAFEYRSAKDSITMRYYYLPKGADKYRIVGFVTPITKDIRFEQETVRRIAENASFTSNLAGFQAPQIMFCGRPLRFGSSCHWMAPHNWQCSGLGQMNWSVSTSQVRARGLMQAQLDATVASNREVLQRDTVPVTFEGFDTEAIRITYKVPAVPRILGQTGRTIIAYYLCATVRLREIHAVLSYFDDEAPNGGFPPMLAEVMKLR